MLVTEVASSPMTQSLANHQRHMSDSDSSPSMSPAWAEDDSADGSSHIDIKDQGGDLICLQSRKFGFLTVSPKQGETASTR